MNKEKEEIEKDPDKDFIKCAKIALESDEVKRSIRKLDKFLRENRDHKYHNIIKLK